MKKRGVICFVGLARNCVRGGTQPEEISVVVSRCTGSGSIGHKLLGSPVDSPGHSWVVAKIVRNILRHIQTWSSRTAPAVAVVEVGSHSDSDFG